MHLRFVLLTASLVSLFSIFSLHAQHRLSGRVTDAGSSEALPYANIRVDGTHSGTTTDKSGRFVLPLNAGEHVLIVSYMGYTSKRQHVTIPHAEELFISLRPSTIELPEVTVTPGDNPALRIIRKAIEMKERQKEKLRNYSLTSHSKLVINLSGISFGGAEADENKVTVSGKTDDTDTTTTDTDSTRVDSTRTRLPVILETQTEAYWAAPDRYKEIVTARKQSAFLPAQGNIMISAFFITDFSRDELNFSSKAPIIGPISEAGLDAYYYRLLGTTSIDSTKIYQIEISPLRDSDPLLGGTIYIADETYALSMVDVRLNDAAMPGMFDTLAFRQNFRLIDDDFWMPADVIVLAVASIPIFNIGLKVDGISVLQDYMINKEINEEFFDRTRIKVLKEADERDSTYWIETQKIPNTDDEVKAYVIADSIKIALDSTRYDVNVSTVFGGGLTGSENMEFRYPGLFTLYHFNRVEGHALSGEFSTTFPKSPLHRVWAEAGYGFSDKRIKYSVGTSFEVFSSPALALGMSRYYKSDYIDSDGDPTPVGIMTLLSWIDKYDYRDFFYRDGWSAWVNYDPWILFPMNLRVARDGFYNAKVNSEWSVFNRDESYRANPPINEGSILSVSGRLSLDTRDLLDNAGEIMRIGRRNHVPTFGAGLHRIDLASGAWDVKTYFGDLSGMFDFGIPGVFSYGFTGEYADGALPTQMLFNLRGGIEFLTAGRGFRTLDFREFGGDSRVTARFTYSFRDWLFRWLRVPFLRDTGWELDFFANGGWTSMRDETARLQTVPVSEAKVPFWEAGFGIDGILTIFRVDMAWRLNHFRPGRNVFIGLGGAVLF